MKARMLILLTTLMIFFSGQNAFGLDYKNRLGIGMNNQLINNIEALSFKIQQSKTFAWSGLAGIDTNDTGGGYGVGLKAFRLLFEEPNLNFYTSLLAAYISQKYSATQSESGFQIDLTLGTEFAIPKIESLGISFEFGISMHKIQDFTFQTVGNNFFSAAVHFYL